MLVVYIICAEINTIRSVCLIDGPLFPSKVNSKCPAIIFAVRRTARVPGRIRLLIVSIITINGINIVGVPWGTKCSNMWFVSYLERSGYAGLQHYFNAEQKNKLIQINEHMSRNAFNLSYL